jgi:hypothetical protein
VRKKNVQRSDRTVTPRRLARWSTLAGAAVAGILLGSLLFEPVFARVAPGRFALETLSVIGARRIAAAELIGASGVPVGTSALTLDAAAVSRRLSSHPWIAEARVTTWLPRKLLVAVVEREPEAIVEIGAPPRGWLVDASGTPFAPATGVHREMHPTLVGVEDAEPGRPHPLLAQGVHIADAVDRHELPSARRVRVGQGDSHALPELLLGPSERRVVLGGGELEAKLERLSRVLEADLAEMGAASTIDLRFGSGVILRDGPSRSGGEATGERGCASPSDEGRAG